MYDENETIIEEVPHPHDRFFRQCIQHQDTHKAFLKKYLPPAVLERINLDQLELVQSTFVDRRLEKKESDCIFLTQFNQKAGYVYTLIEHQQTPDKLMPFRIWKYLLLLMQYHLDSHKTTELPAVYPLVFYSGSQPYAYTMDFTELFNAEPAFIRSILYHPFQLIDLNAFSSDEPIDDTVLRCLLIIMKHVQMIERASPFLKQLLKSLCETGQEGFITAIISYIVSVDKRPNNEVLTILNDVFSDAGVDMPSVARQLKKEGEEIGLLKGKEIGLLKGKEIGLLKGKEIGLLKGEEIGLTKGKIETARNMLKEGLSVSLISKVTLLSENDIRRLQDELDKS